MEDDIERVSPLLMCSLAQFYPDLYESPLRFQCALNRMDPSSLQVSFLVTGKMVFRLDTKEAPSIGKTYGIWDMQSSFGICTDNPLHLSTKPIHGCCLKCPCSGLRM